MITCSRCGKVIPGGLSNCQYCGMPVTNRNEFGGGPGNVASEQSELPAWLQSLRAGTQPTYSTGGPTNFSASNPVDEGALPNWLQPGNADTGNTPSSQQAALRPSSMPAPTTDGIVLANGNMSARSLIDEQSLPSWMQEPASAQQGVAASSLIQPDALPPWLRNAEPQTPPVRVSQPLASPVVASIPNAWAAAGSGSVQPAQQRPPAQSVQSVQMTPPAQQGAPGFQAQGQQAAPVQSVPPVQRSQQASPALPPQGFAAQDLIDPQSLPSWLSGQQAANANGGPGLSAGSLLDVNALPPWLRESGQGQQGQRPASAAGAMLPPPPAPMAQGPGVSQIQQPHPQPQARQASSGNLAAASFIDMDALPEWLRAAGDGQSSGMGQPGMGGYPRQASYGVPPRPENVRVPGRPRGMAGPHEESEVAANVFASMLGVASNAPYLPGQSVPGGPGMPGQQPQYPQVPPQSQQSMPQMGGMPMQGGPMAPGN